MAGRQTGYKTDILNWRNEVRLFTFSFEQSGDCYRAPVKCPDQDEELEKMRRA